MPPNNRNPTRTALMWAVFFIPVLWLAMLAATTYTPSLSLLAMLDKLTAAVNTPFAIKFNEYTPRAALIAAVLYGLCISAYYAMRGNYRYGEEHGTARWGVPGEINSKYIDRRHPLQNIIFTRCVKMGMDSRKHRRNLNVLVVGGSGSGKTRFYCLPNIMQCNTSFLVCDPKGEMLRATGNLLLANGYDIKVLDLINMDRSDGYNPFHYIETDEDVFKLITNLIRNTTPKNAQNNDPFWEKSETALLSALLLYLHHEAEDDEKNFETVMFLIENGGASEEDESYQSVLDFLFDDLERTDPEHIALKEYRVFKQAAGKTAKSILVSAAVRLAIFNLPKVQAFTQYDELDIGSLGERKRAIFAVTPDNDDTFNFLVGMLYTQAFQALYRKADFEHGGRLPYHVHLVMDEFANTANLSPDDFLRVLATMRSREISVSIIIQNLAQLKKQFDKDAWESVTGNCDTLLYLGGNEAGTHEYLSKMLGKSTIDTKTRGHTKGKQGSFTQNYQNAGRELLTPDEVRLLDNKNALLFIRGERPVLDEKYDILKHPNVKLTENGDAPPYTHNAGRAYRNTELVIDVSRIDDYVFV